jgi:magnesium transporter
MAQPFALDGAMLDANTSAAPTSSAKLVLRDEAGDLRAEFVADVAAAALERGDAPALRGSVANLHEADQGDLLEALPRELRPRLIELLGHDFDFAALTEVDDGVRRGHSRRIADGNA